MKGKIKRYLPMRGFGFIKRDDGGPDVFVHNNARIDDPGEHFEVGDIVEFETEPSKTYPDRINARSVRVVASTM